MAPQFYWLWTPVNFFGGGKIGGGGGGGGAGSLVGAMYHRQDAADGKHMQSLMQRSCDALM